MFVQTNLASALSKPGETFNIIIDILEKVKEKPWGNHSIPHKGGFKSELGRESKVAGISNLHLAEADPGRWKLAKTSK
jgi:hypothetical protein